MHECAQWWLVITRPFGDTMLAEHPPARRTDDERTCASHSLVGPKPCKAARRSEGKSLSSHMPSSDVRGAGPFGASATGAAAGAADAPGAGGGGAGGGGASLSCCPPH